MKNFSLATLALAATFAFSSAKAATTDNNVSFSSISFADGIDIEMVEGNAPAIESSDVTYTIDNAGVLTLKASANNGGNSHVRICAPDLKAIQYFGDSNVSVTGNIQANKLLGQRRHHFRQPHISRHCLRRTRQRQHPHQLHESAKCQMRHLWLRQGVHS